MLEEKPSLAGCLLGTAVGDSLGLPTEGLCRERANRFIGPGPLEHRFFLGRGMLSDDTEHACFTLEALAISGGDESRFSRSLAWRLRWWFAGAPAGIGLATAKACLKLWVGTSPSKSGVNSAGNGPCMRAAVLGAALSEDRTRLLSLVDRSSYLTHRDPRAVDGGRVVAVSAARARQVANGELSAAQLIDELHEIVVTEEWRSRLNLLGSALHEAWTAERVLDGLGCPKGVSGFVMHSAPAALWCWLRSPTDFRRVVESAICLGGDTDTVGAIVGGLAGAGLGEEKIPASWLKGVRDWPRTTDWLQRLAEAVEQGLPVPKKFSVGAVPRNAWFLAVVLGHGFRRLFRR